jgi:chromosome segregation ATPase
MCKRLVKWMKEFIKRMKATPGMVEDVRYAKFELATKTEFTPGEYEQLQKDYPTFNDFWQKWKEYAELLKIDLTEKTKQIDKLQTRMVEIQDEIDVLNVDIQKFKDAYTAIETDKTADKEGLKVLFTDKKEEFIERKTALDDEYTSTNNRITKLNAEIDSINTQKDTLFTELDTQVKAWGGTLPTEV